MQLRSSHPVISNQKGQLAIFVALIFQVLFVFFAMAINVGLMVSDKINLQNSVDLAAYYAAQRQAEILNAIAHQNYQIRQSWKVLTWRYRVLGSLGKNDHPLKPGGASPQDVYYGHSGSAGEIPKTVCITYGGVWGEIDAEENLCKVFHNYIPPLPYIPNIATFVPSNQALTDLSVRLRADFQAACAKQGAINWWFAMSILTSYRYDQANRKQVIFALAENLSSSNSADFTDLNGDSVAEGVEKVLTKNLTWENYAASRERFQWDLMNSMQGTRRQNWLPAINTAPTVLFNDSRVPSGGGCAADNKHVSSNLNQSASTTYVNNNLYGEELRVWAVGDVPPSLPLHLSNGVEKNPWIMAYMGVRATSRPRELFWPFGQRVPLRARAFAKPFGGRIGPWHNQNWPATGNQSTGGKTDVLLPPRITAEGVGTPDKDYTRLPNYSRYPGDQLGLNSGMAQVALGNLNGVSAQLSSYSKIWGAMGLGQPNDPLTWNNVNDVPGAFRNYELAIASPDLFDIAYYSIDPHYDRVFGLKLRAARGPLGINGNIPIRSDLGVHLPIIPSYSVDRQIVRASERYGGQVYWRVRSRDHLLTSWVTAENAMTYYQNASAAVAEGRFGRCRQSDLGFDDPNIQIPGGCVLGGGRVGYSVKLVSRAALNSEDWELGGGAGKSALRNPPRSGGWSSIR